MLATEKLLDLLSGKLSDQMAYGYLLKMSNQKPNAVALNELVSNKKLDIQLCSNFLIDSVFMRSVDLENEFKKLTNIDLPSPLSTSGQGDSK